MGVQSRGLLAYKWHSLAFKAKGRKKGPHEHEAGPLNTMTSSAEKFGDIKTPAGIWDLGFWDTTVQLFLGIMH